MKLKHLYLIILCMTFSSCHDHYNLFQDNGPVEYSNKTASLLYEYKIAPQDKLIVTLSNQFNFHQNQEKNGDTLSVSKSGTIILPLLGDVKISGYTEKEASVELAKLFSKYIKEPFVKVEIVNKRAYILGEVKKPGIVPLDGDYTTVVAALASSGGFTDYAKRNSIKILHSDISNPQWTCIDLTNRASLLNGADIIKPNDIIYVDSTKSRGYNLHMQEVMPSLSMLEELLSVFVKIKYLDK